MMAQEAGDQACLQQALTWLYQVTKGHGESADDRRRLVQNLIDNCSGLQLNYLKGLGLLSLAELLAHKGEAVATKSRIPY